jgi:hypothetical protein
MTDTVLRDELHHRIATEVLRVTGTGTQADLVADRILAIPAIKEALAFHEARLVSQAKT